MKHLVEFPLDGGETVLVEVDEVEIGGMVPASPGNVIEKAHYTFDQALDKIKPVAEVIIIKLHSLSKHPDEIQVKFGLKLSAEAGAIVASAGAEGNYEVTLTWKRKEK